MKPTSVQRGLLPLLFLLGGVLTIGIVRNAFHPIGQQELVWIAAWQWAIVTVIAGGMVFATLRRKASALWWEGILNLTVFLGVWYASLLLLQNVGISLLVSTLLTLAHVTLRNVFVHNCFYLIGSIGVAINFAGWLPAEVLVVGLVGFMIYDIVAGAPGGPIAMLVTLLARSSIVPGFILPEKWRSFGGSIQNALQSQAVFLGAGDVILPLALVARSALRDPWQAMIVLGGALLGSFVLAVRKDLHPRSALLPLAAGAALPFLLFFFI